MERLRQRATAHQHVRNIKDGGTASGSVNSVQRVGNTVIRPAGDWSLSVRDLLNYLERKGFDYSPRAIALDPSRNKEVLSYIEGDVAMRPWPACLLAESGIIAVAQVLVRYHQLVADYVPKPDSLWRTPEVQWQSGQIVRHGDLGPWNMVWKSGKLAGFIDWDFAEPGYPIEDLAQVAWDCVPLYPPEKSIQAGINSREQVPRLKALCKSYGADVDEVVCAVADVQEKELMRIEMWGNVGKEPWKTFLQNGALGFIENELRWLHAQYKLDGRSRSRP